MVPNNQVKDAGQGAGFNYYYLVLILGGFLAIVGLLVFFIVYTSVDSGSQATSETLPGYVSQAIGRAVHGESFTIIEAKSKYGDTHWEVKILGGDGLRT